MIRLHFQHVLRAVILLAFSALLFKLNYTGEIAKYINVKYSWLSQTAAGIFVLLFLIQLQRTWSKKMLMNMITVARSEIAGAVTIMAFPPAGL